MAQNTFPAFTSMIPTVEDVQLIMDSLRQEDRYRTTKDGIFTPGIVNEQDSYLQLGSDGNSLKIKPFIAYTANGNRIEVSNTWDNLYAQGNVISVTNSNLVSEYPNVPYWYPFTIYSGSFADLTSGVKTYSTTLTELGRGSILHGIKLRPSAIFSGASESDVFVSIGTESEPDKFLPPTLISDSNAATNISAMNLMYSINDVNPTKIIITFTSNSLDLNKLTNGTLSINVCIANLSGFDNEDLAQTSGGYELNDISVGNWQPSTTYHIVVRYIEDASNYRQLNYTTSDGTVITTVSEPTRFTTNYKFFALRKTGSVIDYTTADDIKLGEITTGPFDSNNISHITSIYINGKNSAGDDYTQYLTIPGYRFKDGINANQIGDGNVSNTQFNYLSGLTGNIQSQLGSKAGLNTDNEFKGENTFIKQIKGSIDKVNGFSANATPTSNSLLVLDENGKVPSSAISESTFASIGNFYTVSSGVTTNGRSSFLAANSTLNGVVISASSENPLIINYPDGSSEKIVENKDLNNLNSDGYYYLVKEKNGNFIFLPTSGGTTACIPVISSNNSFDYLGDAGGSVSKSWNNQSDPTAYKAFDGTISDGVKMGQVVYTNIDGSTPEWVCTPDGSDISDPISTSLYIHFPVPIKASSFAACFRANEEDATPKAWSFEGTNVENYTQALDADWAELASSTESTWGMKEIKYTNISVADQAYYQNFRITFLINKDTINNYIEDEETTGTTMPINCYYFQIYTSNVEDSDESDSNSIKGNIVEGYVQPSGMSVGSYFLDISKKPYIGYKCSGSDTFTKVNYVKLGFVEAIEIGTDNAQINCYPFCYNTFSISDENTTWAMISDTKVNTINISKDLPLTFDHNLGVIPNIVNIKFICLQQNNGYSVGDYIDNIYIKDSIGITSIKDFVESTVTYIRLYPGISTSTLYVKNKETGALGVISNNQWGVVIYCSRGW